MNADAEIRRRAPSRWQEGHVVRAGSVIFWISSNV
jgi:hypothetical protein